jgi:hypothetical protein
MRAPATPPVQRTEGLGELAALDAALLAAHTAGDEAALMRLYTLAAEAAGEIDAACFFLTQAYVFALATGAPEAGALHARLLARGREE